MWSRALLIGTESIAWSGNELHGTMAFAIERETVLNNWNRSWKLKLIEADNPDWQELYDTIL